MQRGTERVVSAIGLWLALAGGSGPSFARGSADLDPDLKLERTRRLGPFHVQPYFRIKQAGYDDNVYLDNANQQGAFTATLGPGIRAVMPAGRRAALIVDDELDYAYIGNASGLNHFNNALRAKLDLLLDPFLVYADMHYDSSRERPNAELDFRVRHSVVGQAAGFKALVSNRITAGLQVTRQDFKFGSSTSPEELVGGGADRQALLQSLRELERVESEASAFVAYRVFRKTSVGLERSEGRADFADPQSQRDARNRKTYLTASFSPSAFLAGSVRLGRLRLEPEERQDSGFNGTVVDVSLGCRISSRSHARLRYDRNVVFSVQSDNLYFITEGWRAAYAHSISDRWSVELERGEDKSDYPQPIALSSGQETALRRDRITVSALAGLLRVQPGTRVGLRLEQWNRHSTFGLEDVRRYALTSFVEYNY